MSRIAPRPKYVINTKPFDKAETTRNKPKIAQVNNLKIMQLNTTTKIRRCRIRNYNKENVSIEPELSGEECLKKDKTEKQNAVMLIRKSLMLLFEAKEKDPEVADPVVLSEPSIEETKEEEKSTEIPNSDKKSKNVTLQKKNKKNTDPKYETLRPMLIKSPRQTQVIYNPQAVAVVISPRPLKRFNSKTAASPKRKDETAQVDTMPELHETIDLTASCENTSE